MCESNELMFLCLEVKSNYTFDHFRGQTKFNISHYVNLYIPATCVIVKYIQIIVTFLLLYIIIV